MKLSDKMLIAIKNSERFKSIDDTCKAYKWDLSFNEVVSSSIDFSSKNGAEVCLNVKTIYLEENGDMSEACELFQFKVGIVTPKGYFSSKKINVDIVDNEDLTEIELNNVMNFYNKDTKENTFDPFYHENNIRSKNASALIYIAERLQPDCRN